MAPHNGASDTVYVVTSYILGDTENEGLQQPEAYTTLAAANAAAQRMMRRHEDLLSLGGVRVDTAFHANTDCPSPYNGSIEFEGDFAAKVRVFKVKVGGGMEPKGWGEKKARVEVKTENATDAEEDDEEDDEEKPSPKRTKRSQKLSLAHASRTKIPNGKPNCLRGLKILFTGTFDSMDRKTSIATAIKYGAEVVTKLEDTDYIVLGTRAGPKKLQIINEKELETITEDEFFQILRQGVSKEKRERMAARRAADSAEGPEDEDEEESHVPVRKKARR